MQQDPALVEIVNSKLVHILSAFAIAESNSSVFRRIVRFLSMKGWELPRNNGIYDQIDWESIRMSRSSFLHGLISEAVQAAIQMDWYQLCDTLLNYARAKQFFVSITSASVSALIENEAYDLMVELLEHTVFIAKTVTGVGAFSCPMIGQKSER